MKSALLLLVLVLMVGCAGAASSERKCTAECGRCAYPLSVRVLTPAGKATPATLSISAPNSQCSRDGDAWLCSLDGGPGTYEFDLAAPGFKTLHVTETVAATGQKQDTCGCGCSYTPKNVEVTLPPE